MGKVQGLKSIIGEVRNSIGNGEAKELICRTHGHELNGGRRVPGRGEQRGKIGTTVIT